MTLRRLVVFEREFKKIVARGLQMDRSQDNALQRWLQVEMMLIFVLWECRINFKISMSRLPKICSENLSDVDVDS